MRILLPLLILIAISTVDSAAQAKKESLKLQRDTLDATTRTGVVVSVSYECYIKYEPKKHDKKQLSQFCNNEIRSLLGIELGRLLPEDVDAVKIRSAVRPKLDSIVRVNGFNLESLTVSKLK